MLAAAVQMCSSMSVDDNLAMAGQLIKEAADNGAKLISLPEMFAFMGKNQQDKVLLKEIAGQGKIQDFLSHLAKTQKVWIIGGTIPIACDDATKIRAACYVFNDKGASVARYDKIHLFDVTLSATETYNESDSTQPGTDIVVIDTPLGRLGLAVCYDVRFPELFRVLHNEGAEILALPSAFTISTGEAHWELLTRSRAVENFCYLIGACQGGTHQSGRKTYGHSLIVNPWGVATIKNDDTPGVVYADIDLDYLQQKRRAIPVEKHQTIFFDTSHLKRY